MSTTRRKSGAKIVSQGLHCLIGTDARVTRIASGFEFTEGPIWTAGGFLLFSDIPANKRYRWHPDYGVSVVRNPSNKCNGMTLEHDGSLIVCEHTTSTVVRETRDGLRQIVAESWAGKQLNSPNDVIVARDGSILFTDPTFGRTALFGLERELDLDIRGVYRVRPDDGSLELLVDDFGEPNGLCFSPDEALLYINDTQRAHIRVFQVASDMSLGGGQVFAERITADEYASDCFVDGMKADDLGNIYVTGPGGVWVFEPGGRWLGTIPVPEKAANMNWGGLDRKTLFITASTSVYQMRMSVSGCGVD